METFIEAFGRRLHDDLAPGYIASLDALDGHVKDAISGRLLLETSSLIAKCCDLIDRCESPIEQILVPYLVDISDRFDMDPEMVTVAPQKEIRAGGTVYRADFFLDCEFHGKQFGIVVECDGHAFHEKSKEQVARDKRRDREFQKLGYYVLRFSGWELWNQTWRCAQDIWAMIARGGSRG